MELIVILQAQSMETERLVGVLRSRRSLNYKCVRLYYYVPGWLDKDAQEV